MADINYFIRLTKKLQERVAELARNQPTIRQAVVTAVDITTQTFSVSIPGEVNGSDLVGIPAVPNHLPDVGDVVNLSVAGGEPTHLAGKVTDALAADPVDGSPQTTMRFGQTVGTRSSVTGEQTSQIDENGNASVNTLSTNSLTVGGQDVTKIGDSHARGTKVWFANGGHQTGIITEYGLAEVYFKAENARNYRIAFGGGFSSTNNDGEYAVTLRMTSDGSRPTSASTILAQRFQSHQVGGRWQDWQWSHFFQRDSVTTALDIHLLLTITRGTGQTTGSVSTPGTAPFIIVEDVGYYSVASGTSANDGSTVGAAPQQANTLTVPATWSRSFRGDGSIRSDTTDMVQGYNSFNGDGKAMVGFTDLTGTLSGATIQSVKLFLRNSHWHYSSGGTLLLGTHGQTAAPGSFSGTTNRTQVNFGPEPSQQWIDVTAWASELKAGTTRGFTLGPSGGTDLTYYGRFAGATDATSAYRPKLQIVYYK